MNAQMRVLQDRILAQKAAAEETVIKDFQEHARLGRKVLEALLLWIEANDHATHKRYPAAVSAYHASQAAALAYLKQRPRWKLDTPTPSDPAGVRAQLIDIAHKVPGKERLVSRRARRLRCRARLFSALNRAESRW